ncbi:AN1 zinc finger protein [Clathrospora elynae]|uniref:AN1 zinc finger protein n=1 Tax=Clathrospora elynae TaxID=706981 RepID=A0A6A5T866_9PLEO|nr:AN1 zinc finger protein [Clathrospora elynae]
MASTQGSAGSSFTDTKGDVEAIGAHCQMEYCHVLDLLPFICGSCRGTYCLDHRTEYAHKCPKEGKWARLSANQAPHTDTSSFPKPSLHNRDQQCSDPACKTLIYTTSVHCARCNRHYCLKHRMEEEHSCKNLTPIGARPQNTLQARSQSALTKLKLWAENKRQEDEKRRSAPKKSGFLGMVKSSSSSAAATAQVELNALKRTAKGEASVPQEKRIYLHVEASADTTKAKFPTGKFYYNTEWTVGRVLDMAAKALQVQNVNNRGGGEEEKLRVFHVEGGRLLKFSEKIGEPCRSGNMIVLLRGVGSGEAPDMIDL